MKSSASFNHDDLDELEGHLTDTIAGIDSVSLSEEERFLVAKHRVGSPDLLSKAYRDRRNFSFERLSWLMQGVFYFLILRLISFAFVGLTGGIYLYLNSDSHTLYLIVSFFCQSAAFLVTYGIFKGVTRISQKSGNTVRANLVLSSALIIIYILSLIVNYFYGPVQAYAWGVITQLFYYLFLTALLVVFITSNYKEWKSKRILIAR